MVDVAKAEFFDTQAESEWAATPYTSDERGRLDRVLSAVGIGRGMRILEPGCGVGRLTELMAERVGPEGTILALDMSRAMARKCAANTRGHGNAHAFRAALEDPSIKLRDFDVVMCHNVFPHFADKGEALGRISSALGEGGRLVIYHFLNSSQINDPKRKISRAVLHDVMPSFPKMRAMLDAAGLTIDHYADNGSGYLLTAVLTSNRA